MVSLEELRRCVREDPLGIAALPDADRRVAWLREHSAEFPGPSAALPHVTVVRGWPGWMRRNGVRGEEADATEGVPACR